MRRGHMAHELRITKPTIRDDHRRRQGRAMAAECSHASIQHDLDPAQLIAARSPRSSGVWPTDGKVHRHHEFAFANDDHQKDPINTREYPVFLAAPPGAHQPQLLAILFEHRVISRPRSTASGCAWPHSRWRRNATAVPAPPGLSVGVV